VAIAQRAGQKKGLTGSQGNGIIVERGKRRIIGGDRTITIIILA